MRNIIWEYLHGSKSVDEAAALIDQKAKMIVGE